MDGDNSGMRLVHSITSSKGSRDVACHVEVDAISSQNLWLPTLSEL